MPDLMLLFDFTRTLLPPITLIVFIIGVMLRLVKWASFGFAKKDRPLGKSNRLIGAIKNWSIDMIPPWDLAGRVEPVAYVTGIVMHISCILILLGALHAASVQNIIGIPYTQSRLRLPAIPASNIPVSIPRNLLTYIITPVFLSSLGIMILRRVYYSLRGGPLKSLTRKGDWVAAPLLWSAGFTGFLVVVAVEPYVPLLTLHLILTQVFIMYLPYSKLIHSATVFLVRTWFGFRKSIYGV
ncbi:hypothetical protein KEJ39_01575 [Candidatus Bathyarchaeota archaeon]|nr:hypothetical protein [Candidatus Bathyarchaeota archaeon]